MRDVMARVHATEQAFAKGKRVLGPADLQEGIRDYHYYRHGKSEAEENARDARRILRAAKERRRRMKNE